MTPHEYVRLVETALLPHADPVRARPMRAYLKDRFPFLGIAAPQRRAAVKSLPRPTWQGAEYLLVAELLWNKPEREYRYSAIDLLARHAKSLVLADLPTLQALALREPWWDTVDALSSVVGDVLRRARQADAHVQRTMDEWLAHPVFWVRRMAMLHQLGWRLETDATRLFGYAATLAGEKEFFIRKAIGWALRDYARWNPEAVRAFLNEQATRLSSLSIREAAKHL